MSALKNIRYEVVNIYCYECDVPRLISRGPHSPEEMVKILAEHIERVHR